MKKQRITFTALTALSAALLVLAVYVLSKAQTVIIINEEALLLGGTYSTVSVWCYGILIEKISLSKIDLSFLLVLLFKLPLLILFAYILARGGGTFAVSGILGLFAFLPAAILSANSRQCE
ncbi:MAG: hypothetical protein D6719_09100 [Candidatus Dadabacteria bacterium]|nr:MAG: hypothetical protein D6719_09100 [Candidatus Dadabacteria bacterium]